MTYADASARSPAPRRSPRRCRWWRHRRCARPNKWRWPAILLCACCTGCSARATTYAAEFSHPLLEVREVRRRAVILVGADKGLCGALNSNVFRVAAQFDPQSTVFITAGRKARAIHRPQRPAACCGVSLCRHAAIFGGQGDRRLCPRPVPETGGGPGPDRRHALCQHAHPAAPLR